MLIVDIYIYIYIYISTQDCPKPVWERSQAGRRDSNPTSWKTCLLQKPQVTRCCTKSRGTSQQGKVKVYVSPFQELYEKIVIPWKPNIYKKSIWNCYRNCFLWLQICNILQYGKIRQMLLSLTWIWIFRKSNSYCKATLESLCMTFCALPTTTRKNRASYNAIFWLNLNYYTTKARRYFGGYYFK